MDKEIMEEAPEIKISDRHFKWLIAGIWLLGLDVGMLFVWSMG